MYANCCAETRKPPMAAVALALVFILTPANLRAHTAQGDAGAMLIEPAQLQQKLGDPALRILDSRLQADYGKGHVPGAVRVDVKYWQALGKKEGGFQDANAWGEKVGALGIMESVPTRKLSSMALPSQIRRESGGR